MVIDQNTHKKFFAGTNPVGQVLFIGSLPCVVTGVTKEKDGPFGDRQNLEVWLPYSAAMNRMLGQQYFSSITVRVQDGISNQIAEQSIIKLLTQRHGRKGFLHQQQRQHYEDRQQDHRHPGPDDFGHCGHSRCWWEESESMNIMLVSVTERTHEIGIRLAVGARQEDILQQFLIESVLVCLMGGLIGVLLSYGVGLIFPLFVSSFAMQFSITSIVSAFLCSSIIGVTFGFLPARNAARARPYRSPGAE